MKKYFKPEMIIKEFQTEDIITGSGIFTSVQSIKGQMESNGILAIDEAKFAEWGQ